MLFRIDFAAGSNQQELCIITSIDLAVGRRRRVKVRRKMRLLIKHANKSPPTIQFIFQGLSH